MEQMQVEGLVLEVGSGNNPNPRSDILCDRYIYNNSQRAGEFDAVIDRPMVVADGYKLPFCDKAFDFVICSHTLEHMSDPVRFLKEISRVGKAGYIEVPSILAERIFGWDFHLWHTRLQGTTLLLNRKLEGERFGGFFHKKIASSIGFRSFFEDHETQFYVQLYWKGQISCQVSVASLGGVVLKEYDQTAAALLTTFHHELVRDIVFYVGWLKRRLVNKLKKLFRRTFWLVRTNVYAAQIRSCISASLRCIDCGGERLTLQSKQLVCPVCHTRYLYDGVIPIMLTYSERKKGY